MSALDSSCRGILLMSEEKGLSGFSRLISQLVLPDEDNQGRLLSNFIPESLHLTLEKKKKAQIILDYVNKIQTVKVLSSSDIWQDPSADFLFSVWSSQYFTLYPKLFKNNPW